MQEKLEKLIAEHFGLSTVDQEDDIIRDLNGDALDVIELVMEIEEAFNILISDDEAERIRFIKDVYDIVDTKVNINVPV